MKALINKEEVKDIMKAITRSHYKADVCNIDEQKSLSRDVPMNDIAKQSEATVMDEDSDKSYKSLTGRYQIACSFETLHQSTDRRSAVEINF